MNDIKLFENNKIRSLWDEQQEEWLFSVVDIVGVLTESHKPRDYWYRVKQRMTDEEKSELSTICRQLKLKSSDGKNYLTDVADLQGIFRIIQSIPSPKAEPLKRWLAEVGKDRIDEIIDPEGSWAEWRTYRDMRSRTSHTYDEEVALQVVAGIPAFLQEAEFLKNQLMDKLSD